MDTKPNPTVKHLAKKFTPEQLQYKLHVAKNNLENCPAFLRQSYEGLILDIQQAMEIQKAKK